MLTHSEMELKLKSGEFRYESKEVRNEILPGITYKLYLYDKDDNLIGELDYLNKNVDLVSLCCQLLEFTKESKIDRVQSIN